MTNQVVRRVHSLRLIAGITLAVTSWLAGCDSTVEGTKIVETATRHTPSATTTVSPNSSQGGEATSLPPMKRFRIGGDSYGPVEDCSVTGSTVTCTSTWDDPYQADTYTGDFSGTLSGMVMTGTRTSRQTGHDATNPSCRWETETSAPITYYFNRDGTLTDHQGPGEWRMTHSGSCSGTESGTTSAAEGGSVRWTVIE